MAGPTKRVDFNAITFADKVRAIGGSVLVVLTALSTIDTGIPVVNGFIAAAGAALLAFGFRPLGPAA